MNTNTKHAMTANGLLSKRAIAIGSLLSLILYAIGFFIVAESVQCRPGATSGSAGINCGSVAGTGQAGAVIATILLFVAFVLMMVMWLVGLLKTARIRQWIWFVVVFLLPPLGSLLYGIFGPSRPANGRPTYIEGTPPNAVA